MGDNNDYISHDHGYTDSAGDRTQQADSHKWNASGGADRYASYDIYCASCGEPTGKPWMQDGVCASCWEGRCRDLEAENEQLRKERDRLERDLGSNFVDSWTLERQRVTIRGLCRLLVKRNRQLAMEQRVWDVVHGDRVEAEAERDTARQWARRLWQLLKYRRCIDPRTAIEDLLR